MNEQLKKIEKTILEVDFFDLAIFQFKSKSHRGLLCKKNCKKPYYVNFPKTVNSEGDLFFFRGRPGQKKWLLNFLKNLHF